MHMAGPPTKIKNKKKVTSGGATEEQRVFLWLATTYQLVAAVNRAQGSDATEAGWRGRG